MSIQSRIHPILAERESQISLNLLSRDGGRPYIERRLTRFPAETDVDFRGDVKSNAAGRLERAYLPNHAARITAMINQYVFQTLVDRDGIDPQFALDVTKSGMTISEFMEEVSSLVTACSWCWMSVDNIRATGDESVAMREQMGDGAYWKVYDPRSVRDWCFKNGILQWILTEEVEYDNDNPHDVAVTRKVRYLWQPGLVTKINESGEQEPIELKYNEIPFVPVGLISSRPWWFDDVEACQRAILDKESALDTAIFKSVYPLLVLPVSVIDNAVVGSSGNAQKAGDEVIYKMGVGRPITEMPDEKGITRYVGGQTTDLKFIREEINASIIELREVVGLAMRKQGLQAQSAEAKEWDHLDVGAVLAKRANMLDDAETRLVQLSKIVDPKFKEWEPKYSTKFNVRSFEEDLKAITEALSIGLPGEAEKMLMRACVSRIADELNVPDKQRKLALDAIDQHELMPMGLRNFGNEEDPIDED